MSIFGKKGKEATAQFQPQMSPDQVRLTDLSTEIAAAESRLASLRGELNSLTIHLQNTKQQIIETDEQVLLQSFGMYTPHYRYALSDEYKKELDFIRNEQKSIIKSGNAVTGNMSWLVDGSNVKGKKMVADMQKLLLRAFNAECDDAIEHVRFSNIDSCYKKINSSAEAISKLGSMLQIAITNIYFQKKINELYLVYEYQMKKQEEKEAAKEARQRQREEAKAAKELEEAKRILEKEQSHYENALSRLNIQIANATADTEVSALQAKKAELEEQLSRIETEMKEVDYRAANQRAGYVYIISNIGAFGENIYKIGMTRRLDPMDRVDELGGASVPFNFDVHAMIFSDDAPKLEAALHNAFATRKLNYINQRREFFNVSLAEIKAVVQKNFDKTVEFVDIAPAEQYRESLRIRSQR